MSNNEILILCQQHSDSQCHGHGEISSL